MKIIIIETENRKVVENVVKVLSSSKELEISGEISKIMEERQSREKELDQKRGQLLKGVLEKKKMSMNDLAKLIETSPLAISRYVNGTVEITYDVVCKIADTLEIPLEELGYVKL